MLIYMKGTSHAAVYILAVTQRFFKSDILVLHSESFIIFGTDHYRTQYDFMQGFRPEQKTQRTSLVFTKRLTSTNLNTRKQRPALGVWKFETFRLIARETNFRTYNREYFE